MPAVSQQQQKFFGMVAAGKIAKPKGMTEADVKKFARTKRKGLPKRASRGDHAKRIASARMSRKHSGPVGERMMAAKKSAGGY
jgi:predicted transcriptional regulator